MPVEVANVDAARAWDGPDGAFWAEHERLYDDGVARLHERLMTAAAISRTDRVLDIGCGNGQTTRDAARRATSGHVVGIDLSSAMLAVAERRATEQGLTNVAFVHGDAQIYPFDRAAYDIAISRTGTMFFADPQAAFANIAPALRPGGRLVQLTWQPLVDNEWLSTFRQILAAGRRLPTPPDDAPGPFSLSDPGRVRGLLTVAGFVDVTMEDVREQMTFGPDVDVAYDFISTQLAWLVADLDDESRQQALAELRRNLEAHDGGSGVWYDCAAWLITALVPSA